MTVRRPPHMNPYEFAVLAALRAKQLLAGCTPRLPGIHSNATMAQMEVADGQVASIDDRVASIDDDTPVDPPR